MSEHRWETSGGHPGAATLLLHLEGELDGREAAEISRHLQDCWECRSHSERLQRGVYTYMNYRNDVLLPSVPPRPSTRSQFYTRLNGAVASTEVRSILDRVLRLLASTRLKLESARAGWIAATISTAAMISLYLLTVAHPPTLNAAEVLHRAILAERTARSSIRQVVHRRIRIRRGDRIVERDIYSAGSRVAMNMAQVDPELNRAFGEANIDWSHPLSAERFSAWRAALPEEQDKITETADGIILDTTPSIEGPIRCASLTLRQSDWRAVAERVEFRSEPPLEITEIAYEIRNASPTETSVEETVSKHISNASPNKMVAKHPTEGELEDAETLLREVAHRLGADVEEMPNIRREQGTIRFSASARNPQRRAEILAALRDLPLVRLDVGDPEHPLMAENAPKPAGSPTVPGAIYTTNPPLVKALADHLGSMNQATEYIGNLRDAYLRVLVQASALRELADRYSPRSIEPLSPESRTRVVTMAADHIAAIRQRSDEYLRLLTPVLDEMSRKQTFALQPDDRSEQSNPCVDWQAFAPAFVKNIRNLQTSFRRLFVVDETDEPVNLSVDALLRQSFASQSALRSQLESVCTRQ